MLPKITIQTDADFTPKGKRRVRLIRLRGVTGDTMRLRWYVSGRIYRQLAATQANVQVSKDWIDAGHAAT